MQASRVARPGVIVAAGWFALVVYAYPGQMTAESFEALRQARTKFFAPENPPALSAMWRWLELLLAGPTAMLVVQSAAFAIGAFMILQRALPAQRAAWATAALLVFPPLMVPLATIWSHSMMTAWLVLGSAALLSERRRVHFAGLGALLLATASQPHALVATLPLVVMLFRFDASSVGLRRMGFALGAWVLISAAALGATKHYSKKPSAPLWSYVEPAQDREWFDVPQRDLPDTALKLGVPTRSTALQDAWTHGITAAADHTPLFSPWLYFALAVVLVPFALGQPELLALLMSGVLLHMAYRNPILVIAAACIALISIIARRART